MNQIKANLTALTNSGWNEYLDTFGHELLSDAPAEKFINRAMKRAINHKAFFLQWNKNIVINAVQGWKSGSDSVLGDGVCCGNTLRLINNEQDNPNVEEEDLVSCDIIPFDRISQALYLTALDLQIKNQQNKSLKEIDTVAVYNELLKRISPQRMAAKLFETDELDVLFKPTMDTIIGAFRQLLDVNADALKASNGLLFLSLFGANHVIYVRVDHERHIYRLYDSNLGRLQFYHTDELCAFMHDLFTIMYSDIKTINAFQMLPKSVAPFASTPTCSSSVMHV